MQDENFGVFSFGFLVSGFGFGLMRMCRKTIMGDDASHGHTLLISIKKNYDCLTVRSRAFQIGISKSVRQSEVFGRVGLGVQAPL